MIFVSVPYEITLLSNCGAVIALAYRFQYLMKLHYSQTDFAVTALVLGFQYLMKLHYSQTHIYLFLLSWVSVPYEITLLSNYAIMYISN